MNRDEQFVRNLEAARSFLHDLIDHPEKIETIEDGATVVLFPSDDPELCEANQEMVGRMVEEGAEVHTVLRDRGDGSRIKAS